MSDLDTVRGIMRKIREVDPKAAADILSNERKDWIETEPKKHKLSAEFIRSCFTGFFKSRSAQPDVEPDMEAHRMYAVYCRDLCRYIHQYCVKNPLILEDIHLNDQERGLLGMPHRNPVIWANEPSFTLPPPKPQV